MDVIVINNCGPVVVSANYWETKAAKAGKFFLSTNAGAFRLLIPRGQEAFLAEMRTCSEVVISRGPWMAVTSQDPPLGEWMEDAVEILFEDGSDNPLVMTMTTLALDRLPLDEDAGRELVFTAWTAPRRGKPHKALERPAWYRRVAKLPCLEPRKQEVR